MKKKLFVLILAIITVFAAVPAFSGCGGFKADVLYELKTDENGEIYYAVRYTGYITAMNGRLEIPAEHSDGNGEIYPVKEVLSEGFRGTSIEEVSIPKSVTKIGSAAFANCEFLKKVAFESGCTADIAFGAFAYDTILAEVTLPECKTIQGRAFTHCGQLKEISFPGTLETIGYEAFYATGLEQVIIPESVHDRIETDGSGEEEEEVYIHGIGVGAFWDCASLTLAVVNARVERISSCAFGYCRNLKEVYLPETVKRIDGEYFVKSDKGEKFYCGHAFQYATALTDVYFAGTEEQWNAVEIDNKTTQSDGINNQAVIDATKHFNAVYAL